MDVYHKVLAKLYQVTGGKDSALIDLKDLVKGMGFLGNYEDILQMLSGQGWIVETSKVNFIRITHWGVKEAAKSNNGQPNPVQALKKDANSAISEIKQLLIMFESFVTDTSEENFRQIEKKLSEINAATAKLKSGIQ